MIAGLRLTLDAAMLGIGMALTQAVLNSGGQSMRTMSKREDTRF